MGNRLIFLYLSALKPTLPDMLSTLAWMFKRPKSAESRNGEKQMKA
jgi:hypothetical protein